jgi:hypothetical protein
VWKQKGCDIGYAPATSSCEEASSVDTCTIAALDVITAFAVPNPNCPSQDQSVFSGLVALQVALLNRSLSLFGLTSFISSILSAVDVSKTKQLLHRCQRNSQRGNEISVNGIVENRVFQCDFMFRPSQFANALDQNRVWGSATAISRAHSGSSFSGRFTRVPTGYFFISVASKGMKQPATSAGFLTVGSSQRS